MNVFKNSPRSAWTGLALGALASALACGNGVTPPADGTGGVAATGGGPTSSGGAAQGAGSVGNVTRGSTGVGGAGGSPAGSGGQSATGGSGATPGVGGGAGILADVVVAAGAFDRDHTIVSFEYPAGAGQSLILRGESDVELPVQVDAAGVATFILPTLASGAEASFTLETPATVPAAAVTATETGGVVRLAVGSSTVADFITTANAPGGVDATSIRAGYLHPVHTPAGTVVTDDYRDGDSGGGHPWHHGIWAAWTQAELNGHVVDFWNSYQNQGSVDLESVDATWAGPVHAGLDAHIVHADLLDGGSTAINERWVVRAYKTHTEAPPYLVFDLESTQTATTPITLLEWDYGGFAIRGRVEWRDTPANASFLASDGLNRSTGNGQSGRWCFVGGTLAGEVAGVAALGHPANFRGPQKMRIHDTLPYMTFAPVRDGDFTLEPATPYVTRFRYVTTDGPPDAALFDRLWNDYATPPTVAVTPR